MGHGAPTTHGAESTPRENAATRPIADRLMPEAPSGRGFSREQHCLTYLPILIS